MKILDLLAKATQINPANLVAKIGPWLAPITPAYFIYRSMVTILATPWYIAVVAGLTVEVVGVAISKAALAAYTYNAEKRKSDPPAPFVLSLILCFLYLFVGVGLTTVLEIWPLLAPAAPGVFFLLAGIAYVVIALNSDQERRESASLAAKAEEKEERRRAREERKAERERSPERPRTEEVKAERSPELDELLANVRARSEGVHFGRANVQEWTERGKTSAAQLVKYGLTTGQLESVGRNEYRFVNGVGGDE